MDLDLLELLDGGGPSLGPESLDVPNQAVAVPDVTDEAAEAAAQSLKLSSQVGQVGHGRHGGIFERRLLACHMRASKMARRSYAFGQEVAELLKDPKFLTEAGDIIGVRARVSDVAGGLQLQLSKRSKKGNRYHRSILWAEFLEAAFGRFRRNSAIAVYLNKGVSTVKNMQVFVCGSWMNQQALQIAKLCSFASVRAPLLIIKHQKFDETALLCSLNPQKNRHRSRSTWQTMIYRLRLIVIWPSGENVVLQVALPPVVLLSTGAASQFYALHFHPSFKVVNNLVSLLQKKSEETLDLIEADGAAANERLIAHLYKLAKESDKLMSHARCMNHAVQLTNAAVLSSLDQDLLSRLYSLSTFLRNLGYWGRLQQAVRQWLSQSLLFRPESLSVDEMPAPDRRLRELLSYLQFWRDLEARSESEECQDPKTAERFKSKVDRLLDMFNGEISGAPCHVCTHWSLPPSARHCQDRMDCIRKCTDALLDIFVSCMPTIPAPSKWTTMFGSLDFCLHGLLMHGWLVEAYKIAFSSLTFAEFEDGGAEQDPRLIEALSFSAVNGRRHQGSLRFLQDADTAWTVACLSIIMEATRCLTWYWMGSLKKSLNANRRCVLFETLDPEVSAVRGVLQHLSSLVMNVSGTGRVALLSAKHVSFEEFCLHDPAKVRLFRRLLMLVSGWVYRRQHVYMHDLRYAIAILGDSQANDRAVQRVLLQWDTKRHCCTQPGIARMLKMRGLSSQDLCSPKWRSVMCFYGSTLQWSICDVESKHAVNRLSAGSAFSTICAKYVNSEANLIQKQSSQEHVASSSASSGSMPAPHGGRYAAISQKETRKGQGVKAQPALELFRADFLKREARAGVANPCTKEMWDAVRAAYAGLTQQQKQVYQSLAEDSQASASAARARAKHERGVGEISVQDSEQMSVVQLGQPQPVRPIRPWNAHTLSFQEMSQAIDLQSLMSKLEAAAVKKSRPTGHPISETVLQNVWKAQCKNGVTWKDACNRFRMETERIARPSCPAETFPSKVLYEGHCGEQCRFEAGSERVRFHCNLVSSFCRVVKLHGKISEAVKADILLAFEVFHPRRQLFTIFAFLTSPSARSGVHKPDQVFVEAAPVNGRPDVSAGNDRFNGLDLQLQTQPYVAMKKVWLPLQGGDDLSPSVGPLLMRNADEFAKHLLDLGGLMDSAACTVQITKLLFEDLWPSSVRVTGRDESMQVIVVDASEPADGAADEDENAAPEAPQEPLQHADLDFLALLDAEKPRKTPRGRHASRDIHVPEVFASSEDVLADPELQSIVGQEEFQRIRNALHLCVTPEQNANDFVQRVGDEGSQSESDSEIEQEIALPAEAQVPAVSRPRPTSRGHVAPASSMDRAGYLHDAAQEEVASSSSSRPPLLSSVQRLRQEADLSEIRLVRTGRPLEPCRVERVQPNGAVQVLGAIKLMVKTTTGHESYQAVCRVHSGCVCWFSKADHLDLLIDWLSHAHLHDLNHHQALAASLKTSIGMRVRAGTQQSG